MFFFFDEGSDQEDIKPVDVPEIPKSLPDMSNMIPTMLNTLGQKGKNLF